MGCSPSRASAVSVRGMGGKADIVILTPKNNKCPLNKNQIFILTKSWKQISKHMEKTGVAMFIKLFQENTEINHMFSHLVTADGRVRSKDAEKQLENHGSMVMYTIDECITGFTDMDVLFEITRKTGKQHRKMTGFNIAYWTKIEAAFLSAVRQTLDDRFTNELGEIYREAIRYILQLLVQGYHQAGQPGQPANGQKK